MLNKFCTIAIALSCFLLSIVSPPACASYGPVPDLDTAPLVSSDKSLAGSERLRALGPLVELQRRSAAASGILESREPMTGWSEAAERYFALRPLFSFVQDVPGKRHLGDVLWPLAHWHEGPRQSKWRVATILAQDFDTNDPDSRYRFMAFPFVFSGRSREGRSYFALFPLGGKIHEMLAQDTIVFALFPLYLYMRHEDIETYSYLWPFISRRKGTGVDAFRVFPFYMHSRKDGRWEKTSVMWPLWHSVEYNYENEKGGGFILFPLFGRIATDSRKTIWVIPPFFQWAESGEGKHINCPWPFIQYSSGETDKLYLWPLWGRKSTPRRTSSFFLWPVVHYGRDTMGEGVRRHFKILPVFYYEDESRGNAASAGGAARDRASELASRYVKIWPLLSYRREAGQHLFRFLSLWPLEHSPAVERNLAPLWTLFSSKKMDERREDELLWGLVSRRREGEHYKKWSWLMGLIQYERDAGQKHLRLLYFLKLGGN
jgi:hypothetical protein